MMPLGCRSCHSSNLQLVALLMVPALVASAINRPSLMQVEKVLHSTARKDFDGNDAAFQSAVLWDDLRLTAKARRYAAYLACTEYGRGQEGLDRLESVIPKSAIRRVSNKRDVGTCYIVAANASQSSEVMSAGRSWGNKVSSFGPIPSALKLAPDLLDYEGLPPNSKQQRLTTIHDLRVRLDNVLGLDISLAPGVVPARSKDSQDFIHSLQEDLMSGSLNLYSSNVWSDPAASRSIHRATETGALRAREWTRAADVIHELSSEVGTSPGDICSWKDAHVRQTGNDFIIITGIDHLMHGGRGAGGSAGEESDELKTACLMGLISVLASVPEVRRITPLHITKLNNAVANAITQSEGRIPKISVRTWQLVNSGNIEDTPLTDIGLDGSGEVIQIVDSGLDESSCFFADESGEEVEQGHYFEEIGFAKDYVVGVFEEGYFPIDMSLRKIVQLTRLVKSDEDTQSHDHGFSTTDGQFYYWYSASGFGIDFEEGHGTHTAGSAAGSLMNNSVFTDCSIDEGLDCLGGCVTSAEASAMTSNAELDFEMLCPAYDCDNFGEPCLDAVEETLKENGGVAQGAKLSIFDVSANLTFWGNLVLTGLWESTAGTGCLIHSNSWGLDDYCYVNSESAAHDEYMFENPEHLLLFAAGNEGDLDRTSCTINAPGIGKNVLAVGATSSGSTRRPFTSADGDFRSSYTTDFADIDTVAFFSSYGFTRDNRIKPEVVAPGDQVISAASDGTDLSSCRLAALSGTSMATPIVAGAAAMIRQYFKNDSFYALDVNQRELCGDDFNTAFVCEAFSPSAATVKAMLVNSADLMGGSSEPDGYRGFGRVYLEGVLPVDGEGDMSLFVVDALDTSIDEYTTEEYNFEVASGTGLEFRATLSWVDPPAEVEASIQLINDLDLTVTAPDGTLYTMWSDGTDAANVIERIIVPSDVIDANSGDWTVAVSCADLEYNEQPYSLVVTGPIVEGSGEMSSRVNSASKGRRGPGITMHFVSAIATVIIATFATQALRT